eukprot:GHVL01023630.1.p2 GENE.GHVL01023630.1~~GHVL01023630.1.p2  ORF type:complete len:153 (-),score=13.52 GHVL01023630.1:1334-1792(-)
MLSNILVHAHQMRDQDFITLRGGAPRLEQLICLRGTSIETVNSVVSLVEELPNLNVLVLGEVHFHAQNQLRRTSGQVGDRAEFDNLIKGITDSVITKQDMRLLQIINPSCSLSVMEEAQNKCLANLPECEIDWGSAWRLILPLLSQNIVDGI